jgi:hypothetical protein
VKAESEKPAPEENPQTSDQNDQEPTPGLGRYLAFLGFFSTPFKRKIAKLRVVQDLPTEPISMAILRELDLLEKELNNKQRLDTEV